MFVRRRRRPRAGTSTPAPARKHRNSSAGPRWPCVLGAVSSVAALAIGFIPPSQFGHSNPVTYVLLILAGVLAIGIVPPLLMDRLRRPGWKAT